MSYTCRVYSNSGFNAVNIPDSPALLDNLAFVDYPALEILQDRNLPYIDIKVSGYAAIKNADYARVNDWFYFVEDIIMLSLDTARLNLIPDFITSAGGISVLQILDGITSRVHVGSDNYGEWTEPDPYMAPATKLSQVMQNVNGSGSSSVVVKTSLNLSAMGDPTATKSGVTYADSTTGETVTVPKTIVNDGSDDTTYAVSGQGVSSLPSESATKLFSVNNANVKKGLAEVNDLGINGAISAQVALPNQFVTLAVEQDGRVSSAVGKDYSQTLNLPFEYSGATNKKIDYSAYTPFGIMSASGDHAEFDPVDIYTSGSVNAVLRVISDPRTDGKPYFRFRYFKGDDSFSGFFINAVEGIPWKETPLVYEGASGKALTQLAYNQNRTKIALDMQQRATEAETAIKVKEGLGLVTAGTAGLAIGVGISALSGGAVPAALLSPGAIATGGAAIGSIGNMALKGFDEWTGRAALNRAFEKYNLEKKLELQNYMVQTQVYEPVVQFPFSADLFNDLYINPCLCYRYEYTPWDVARIDKILTMYGYRVTKPLENSDFSNRQYFNYVESSISVGGNIPRWLANGISLQIANGVRVWHVLPNRSYYTNNPIV